MQIEGRGFAGVCIIAPFVLDTQIPLQKPSLRTKRRSMTVFAHSCRSTRSRAKRPIGIEAGQREHNSPTLMPVKAMCPDTEAVTSSFFAHVQCRRGSRRSLTLLSASVLGPIQVHVHLLIFHVTRRDLRTPVVGARDGCGRLRLLHDDAAADRGRC